MRTFSAHYIFPANTPPLKNGIIKTTDDGTIVNIIDTHGKITETAQTEFFNGIIVPGFINTHCHLELSHLKGKISPHSGLPHFIKKLKDIRTAESSDMISAKIAFFDKLMWQNGIVAVGDVSNNSISFPIKKESKIHYHSFIEFFGLSPQNAHTIYNTANKKLKTLKLFNLTGNIVPHAPYSISPELFELFRQDTHLPNEIISIHFQETDSENSYFKYQTGSLFNLFQEWKLPYPFSPKYKTSIDYILQYLQATGRTTIFVHNTFADKEDIKKIKENTENPFLCLCPNSNLYIENKLPDISLLKNSGLPITIGTDSLASNKSLSILEEMKTLHINFPELNLEEIIRWATFNGAKSLKIEHQFGSLTKTLKPGINLIENLDMENLKLLPETTIRKLI